MTMMFQHLGERGLVIAAPLTVSVQSLGHQTFRLLVKTADTVAITDCTIVIVATPEFSIQGRDEPSHSHGAILPYPVPHVPDGCSQFHTRSSAFYYRFPVIGYTPSKLKAEKIKAGTRSDMAPERNHPRLVRRQFQTEFLHPPTENPEETVSVLPVGESAYEVVGVSTSYAGLQPLTNQSQKRAIINTVLQHLNQPVEERFIQVVRTS